MRRFAFSRPLFGAAVTLALFFFPPTTATAQTEEADTSAADTAAVEKAAGRVKISIDESGISIEGRGTVSTAEEGEEGDEWVEVYDDRRRYKEKGLDIVKVGESVFVAKDEFVRGNLVVFGGNAIIEGRVGGDVVVFAGDIRARSGAVIKGDAVVIGGMLDEDTDVIINGERATIGSVFPTQNFWFPGPQGGWFKLVLFPVWLFVQLILSFLVLLFLRDRIVRSDDHLSDNYLKGFGVGLLTVFISIFGLMIISFTLFITIIGIPLMILLWISCGGIMVFAWTVFAHSFGRLVANRLQMQSDNAFLLVFVGTMVLNLPMIVAWGLSMTFAPFMSPISATFLLLGLFAIGFAHLGGIGALILSRFGSRPLDAGQPAPPAPPTPRTADVG
jgi:hypothetical protein